MQIDLDELEQAAKVATPGPWRWEFNGEHKNVSLVGGRPLFDKIVMDFERWGMGGAAPRFNEAIAGNEYNIMTRIGDRPDWVAPFPGRKHHGSWCAAVTHPDARLIEAANPATILGLVHRLREAEHRSDVLAETIRALSEIVTTSHESKEAFIARVRFVLSGDPDQRLKDARARQQEAEELAEWVKQKEKALHEKFVASLGGQEADCEPRCTWSLPTLPDALAGIWHSSCGATWSFVDGGPVENDVRYCQGCGRPVDVQPVRDEQEAKSGE